MSRLRNLLVVCGVRPHYVKWAGLSRVLANRIHSVEMIDVRQHYDAELTDLLLQDLNLEASRTFRHESRDPHERGGRIFSALCILFSEGRFERLPAVLVFGDVTATVMAAVAASLINCPLIHVEAGVRSPRGASGESIENRIRRVTAQVSSLNLCVLPAHVDNLARERAPGDHVWVGDLGRDFLLDLAGKPATPGSYVLVHIHKTENTSTTYIDAILRGIAESGLPAMFIVHPSLRSRPLLENAHRPQNVSFVPPMSHSGLARAMANARVILTDSGSVQREAYHLRKRCVVRRDTVGWGELIQEGGHVHARATAEEITLKLRRVWDSPGWSAITPAFDKPQGTEEAIDRIIEVLKT